MIVIKTKAKKRRRCHEKRERKRDVGINVGTMNKCKQLLMDRGTRIMSI